MFKYQRDIKYIQDGVKNACVSQSFLNTRLSLHLRVRSGKNSRKNWPILKSDNKNMKPENQKPQLHSKIFRKNQKFAHFMENFI